MILLLVGYSSCRIAYNVPAALRSWGVNCTQFGLSLTVLVPAAVWVVTPPPNFVKPLVKRWHFP